MKTELPACPVEMTLQIIGNRWSILIVRDLMSGTKRFGELMKSIDGISQKVLTQNLRKMEGNNIVHRKVYAQVPPKVEYSLTKIGKTLEIVIDSMFEWGEDYKKGLE